MNPNMIILSHATYVGPSGATAAATYSFMTSDYKPPSQERHIDSDTVHNQNGKFKYIYDNGPGFHKFSPFGINCENKFSIITGFNAALQYAHLRELWVHPGILKMQTPDGTFNVNWSESLDRSFRVFPNNVGDTIEYVVAVQFDEAS